MKKRTTINITQKQINISRFSTFMYLQTDKNEISEQMEELKDEKEALESDLATIKDAIQAASKMTGGETPSKEENECLLELKDNYPTFFDSEGEEEGTSLLNKILSVKRYLKKELSSNKKAIFKLSKKDPSKSADVPSLIVEEKGESSKRKAEHSDSEESSSSKKSRSSVNEFLDELPYNPFDDTGTD